MIRFLRQLVAAGGSMEIEGREQQLDHVQKRAEDRAASLSQAVARNVAAGDAIGAALWRTARSAPRQKSA